jgi:hypothetical protein
MTQNWRTNLGGSLGTLGTALIGVGTLTQLTQLSPTTNVLTPPQLAALWWVALAGFVISGVGKFFTSLFAADAKALADSHQKLLNQIAELQSRSNFVPDAIDKGDTSLLRNASITPAAIPPPVKPTVPPIQ